MIKHETKELKCTKRGENIIQAYQKIIENQKMNNEKLPQCYGDFSNHSPFANFNNHHQFGQKG